MTATTDVAHRDRRRWWMLAGAIALLALLASATGMLNDFTYDDRYIVLNNPHVRTLHYWWRIFTTSYWPHVYGGDGYRPLTILAFALQAAVDHAKPWLFHLVNILAYAGTSVAVFWLAGLLVPETAAWVAAALFAVHPVHVEAVAGVVGYSEITVALCVVLAVATYIRARSRGALSLGTIAGISALYVAAFLTKEHGIVLPAILILAEATVIQDPEPLRKRLFVRLRPFWLWLALLGFAFLLVRSRVLEEGVAGFRPFIVFETLRLTYAQRVLTMFGVVPAWIRLMLWPAHLSVEYGPPYVDIAQGPEIVQIPGFLLLVSILAIAVALRRRMPVVTFAIGWVAITLLPASNFIIPAGIILAERTLFLPSVGAMILVGSLVPAVRRVLAERKLQVAGAAALGAVLALGAWRSFDRTMVWHDNDRLFRQSVVDSPLMYRSHYMLGAWLFQNRRQKEAEQEFRRALHLFPYDPFMAVNLADHYADAGLCAPAEPLYRWAFALSPDAPISHIRHAACLVQSGQYASAKREAILSYQNGTTLIRYTRRILQAADSAQRDSSHAEKASAIDGRAHTVSLAGKVPETVQNPRADAPHVHRALPPKGKE